MTTDAARTAERDRFLAGLRAWLITDGKAGMDVQARGVADALGVKAEIKKVAPSGVYKFFSPYGPVASHEFGHAGGQFAPPWPDIAIATGRLAIPYIRALKRRAGNATFTIVLQDPRTGNKTADLVWVPQHDRLRGPNVVTTSTSPHSFSQARLAALRARMPSDIATLPGPRIAVILGGKNGIYKFTDACDDRLGTVLRSLASTGSSFMITPSRRTHARLLNTVDQATADAPRILWNGEGANPYPDFLAHADALIVTADSVNMCGEAAATGKPVYIFTPQGGSDKFDRFHNALRSHGATRVLPDDLTTLETWTYRPLDAAAIIAEEIKRRLSHGHAMIVGT
jgi:mitochondrial fission protein ELM1